MLVQRDPVSGVGKRAVPAEYTCFIKQADLSPEHEMKLRDTRHVHSMRKEGTWWRVRWRNWKLLKKFCAQDGPFAKAGIPVYEADVNPVRRFLTDNDVTIQKPRRCYLDLEVDSTLPVARQIEGKARILTWALTDDEGNKVYGLLEADTDEAEETLLKDLYAELLEYDQVCAWGGDRYDFPVLQARTEFLDIKIERRRWLWLDHMDVYRRLNMSASESGEEKESMALDRIAQAVLGRGKHEVDTRNTRKIWETDPWLLVDYNIEDVVLMRDIEEKTGFLELHFTVCEVCNTLPDSKGTNPTNFVEGYMLKLGLQHDTHFATKFDVEFGGKYEGAYVMEPTKKGILKGIHVCDFASLYPSIIITWNMSPDTLTDIKLKEDVSTRPSYLMHAPVKERPLPPNHCVAPYTECVFRTDTKGILPMALEKLLELRAVWKKKKNAEPPGTPAWKEADRRTSAFKIAANSFYGVQGSVFSRFHVRDVAESVTQAGKWLILQTHEYANGAPWNFESIYGDTDSLFIGNATMERFQEFVDSCNSDLYPRILAEKGCHENRIKLGYEKEFSRLVLLNKKRYAGKYEHFEGTKATADSKPEIKGLEYKRGDTTRLARQMQWELVQKILYDEIEDIEHYRDWLREWRKKILDDDLPLEDVRRSQKLSKDVRLYHRKTKNNGEGAALPVHVEVALEMAKTGADVGEGVRIEYIVVDGRSPLKAIPAHEYDGTNADRYYLWENLVYPPTMRVLQAALPAHKWKDYEKIRPHGSGRPRQDFLGQGLLF